MPKTPPPVLGFNNNVRHQGRIFHIQTEDSGVKRPHVKTHLFGDGGRILKSARTDYAEHVGREDLAQVVRQMMKDQHKAMFVALRKGELNAIIEEAFGPPPAPKAAAAGAAPAQSSSSPPAAAPPEAAAPPSPDPADERLKTDIAPPPSHSEPPLRMPQAGAAPDHPEMVPPPVSRPASGPPPQARRPVSSPPAAPPRRASSPPVTTSAPPTAVSAPPGVARPRERVPSGASTRRPAGQEPTPQPVASAPHRPSSPPRIGTPAFGTPRVARPPSGTPGRGSRPPSAAPGRGSRPPSAAPGRGSRPPSGAPARGSRPPSGAPPVGSRPPSDPSAGRYSVVPPPDEAERYAVSRPASIFGEAKPARSIFGDDEMVGEKSLDEVILSYLAEDLEQPPRK